MIKLKALEMTLTSSLRKAQRHAIFQQLGKNRSPAVIHRNLKRIYGSKGFTLQGVVYQRRRFERGEGLEDSVRSGRSRIEGLEMAIVDESVTAGRVSARKLQWSVKASRNTLLRRMHELGGEYLPVQRQPHALRESDKRKRVELAGQLHKRLVAKNTWPRIITGDEAWIYLRNDSKAEWVVSLGQEEHKDGNRGWRLENPAHCLLVIHRIPLDSLFPTRNQG